MVHLHKMQHRGPNPQISNWFMDPWSYDHNVLGSVQTDVMMSHLPEEYRDRQTAWTRKKKEEETTATVQKAAAVNLKKSYTFSKTKHYWYKGIFFFDQKGCKVSLSEQQRLSFNQNLLSFFCTFPNQKCECRIKPASKFLSHDTLD